MGQLATMGPHGDVKVKWDENDPNDVEKARTTFLDLIKKGFRAFRMNGDKQGERIDSFDPKAKEIIMIPQIAGG